MSNATVDQAYIDTFEGNVRHLAQQKFSKLRSTVNVVMGGETHSWDRLSGGEAAAKTRKMATPETGRTWSRRVAVATPWNDAEVTELEDPSMMLIDPNAALVRSLGMSMGRIQDTLVIRAGVEAAALEGDGGTEAFPTAQNIGDGSADISFDLVTQVQEKFLDNNIDPDVPKYAVVGPKQVTKLMQLTENTSADYVEAQRLQNYGIAPNWLGFTWINSTLLNNLDSPLTDELYCMFYTDFALGFNIPQDVHAEVAKDPSLSFAWQVYCQLTAGAVRIEDEHIVRLHVANA